MAQPLLSRREKILGGLDLSSLSGAEIGALASPQVAPAEGRIFYIDHADTPTLRRYYANHANVDKDAIVEVSGVWGEQTLRECVGTGQYFDYVVACHVIEHVPDLITWLDEIRSILKPTGTLRLAIPDRRFTFDYLRPETQPPDVLDAYLRRDRKPQPRTLIEYLSLACDVDVGAAWRGEIEPDKLNRRHSLEFGLNIARDIINNGTYHDAHCWVFTPQSFGRLCVQIAGLNLLSFALERFHDTAKNDLEFFVHLRPCNNATEIADSFRPMMLTGG
jgi:SAM-dependent methyltransferase